MYVARFRRIRPALRIATGGAVLVTSSARGRLAPFPLTALAMTAAIALIGAGVMRLTRGHRRGWVALTVDSDGIYFAATPPDGEARRFTWDEVSALVLFSRRTELLQGAIDCVGVRLHPTADGSPEHHLARLERTLSQVDLELHVWEQLRELDAGPSPSQLETAVSAHTEVRGWACHRLREAVRAHAPGVPVLEFAADSYYDLVGWRADQERLRAIVEDAELRRWGS